MEALKKFFVLLTSLIIVAVVVYLISISTPTTIHVGSPSVKRDAEKATPPPEGGEESESPLADRDSLMPPRVKEIPRRPLRTDTIQWHKAPGVRGEIASTLENLPASKVIPNPVFIQATNRILPSVVSIVSKRKMRWIPRGFRREDQQEQPDEEFYHPGSGSGIIISENGYILTNYHVVEQARELRVKLYDKREFYAQFVGGDPTTDISILKIEASDLPFAYFGNSDSVQIGEWVIAVGNPLNFTSTVTTGIISALGRDINIINEQYRIENFIQTDAVINPGNSGGALVNLNGEVIGINTAIATKTGLYQGYGFAIPVNLAKKVVDDILKYGHVRRGLLGVSIAAVDDRVARGSGLPSPTGALIQGVTPGFPAEKVGLKPGDIILSVNSEEVVSVNDLQIKIARHHPGDQIRLKVWRDKRAFEVNVTLGEAPVTPPEVEATTPNDHLKFENLGLKLRSLSGEEKNSFGTDYGLVIEEVQQSSPASEAGLRKGDILVTLNGKPLRQKEDFEELLKMHKEGDVLKLGVKFYQGQGQVGERIAFVEVP